MKTFLDDSFLLDTPTARDIFESVRNLPIVDYHCHLNPAEIADNRRYNTVTEIWLGGDHYKWRLMRANGADERYITGDAPDDEKFAVWCETVEDCIGSPLYHWAHMELRRYFNYDGIITAAHASEIYTHCNAVLKRKDFDVWHILKRFNVRMLATTDDPADSLEHHRRIKALDEPGLPVVLPAFRPSKVLEIENLGFADYIQKLSGAAQIHINDWDSLLAALAARVAFFDAMGCRESDHSLEPPVFTPEAAAPGAAGEAEAARIFHKALHGETVSSAEVVFYKTRLLLWLGRQYADKNWIMQFHIGAQRNNNTRMYELTGPDTGFDSMSDVPFAWPLSRILDTLETRGALPKTVLYALNPNADDMLSTMIGNFQGRGIRGRMQWGCPWWFNDNITGITKHLTTLANNGILARFIGMLTDSRSFMSYPRHEYFRRILSNTLAGWVERGEFPDDREKLKTIAANIAYYNISEYLDI